jgi:hypothetical protein
MDEGRAKKSGAQSHPEISRKFWIRTVTFTTNLRLAEATDSYTLKGGAEETFEPHFTSHGFRFKIILAGADLDAM